MTIAISLPDELFREIDAHALATKTTRSGLLIVAAREFLARQRRSPNPTDAWNDALQKAGGSGSSPEAAAFQHRTKSAIRASERPAGR